MTDPSITASSPIPERGGPPNTSTPPPGPGVMRAEYALTADDAVAFFRYDITLSPRVRRRAGIPPWAWLIMLGVVIAVGLVIRFLLKPEPYAIDFLDLVFLVALAWFLKSYFFGNRLTVRRSLRAARHDPRFFQQKTMTIFPEGLNVSDTSGTRTTHWHALVWVVEHGEHVFFYVTERHAIIVPKHAFVDDEQFVEFVDTARHYHAEARRFLRREGAA